LKKYFFPALLLLGDDVEAGSRTMILFDALNFGNIHADVHDAVCSYTFNMEIIVSFTTYQNHDKDTNDWNHEQTPVSHTEKGELYSNYTIIFDRFSVS
jgi:hypothetical protein